MATSREFTDADVLDVLKQRIARNGLRQTARDLEFSAPFVNDVEKKKKGLSEAIAGKLGFEVVPPPPPPPRIWRAIETQKPGGKK